MINLDKKTELNHYDIEQFRELVSTCDKCDLSKTRNHVVFGEGPIPCNLMIIGEGPGEQEDETGKPFVGRSGQLLTKILESIDIKRPDDVFIANTVKCRPPKNRTPLQEEIESCKNYLINQIQRVQPKVLLLLGAPSLKTILEEKLSISKVRGKWYRASVDYMKDPLYIMPLFHPSYLLRYASKEKGSPKWLTWQDMQEVKNALSVFSSEL